MLKMPLFGRDRKKKENKEDKLAIEEKYNLKDVLGT